MQYSLQNLYQRFHLWIDSRQSSGKQAGKTSTITALDGVRAIAALFVIGFHIDVLNNTDLWVAWQQPIASAIITFGGSGVTLFFVLSGFLLFMPYAKALLFEAKWPSAKQFYIRRALRILPGYYVALALIILFFQPQYLQPAYWKRLLLFITMFMDSAPQTFRQLNGPFWTLAVEWQFYLLMPLIMFAFYWVVQKIQGPPQRRLLIVLGCCIGLILYGLTIRYIGIYAQRHPEQTFYLPATVRKVALFFLYGMTGKYLENFAMGMLICTCYIYAQHPQFGQKLKAGLIQNSRWLRRLGLVLLLFIAIWHFQVMEMPVTQFNFLNPLKYKFDWLNEMLISIGYSAWVLAILFGSRSLQALFSFPPLRKIGTISFGLYMWHLPLLDLFHDKILPHLHIGGPRHVYFAYWIWVLICVIPVATASYLLVERPWMKLRSRPQPGKLIEPNQLKAAYEADQDETAKRPKIIRNNPVPS